MVVDGLPHQVRWSEWSRQGVRGIQMGSDAQLVLGAAATDRNNLCAQDKESRLQRGRAPDSLSPDARL